MAIYALIGAIVGTAIAAFLGYLVGQGMIDVTGAILGVITRLAMAREKPAFTDTGIRHGGVVLVVNGDEGERHVAKEKMKKAGAYDLVNLSETWNQETWSEFKELQPPSGVS